MNAIRFRSKKIFRAFINNNLDQINKSLTIFLHIEGEALVCESCTDAACSTTAPVTCPTGMMCITASIQGKLLYKLLSSEIHVLQSDVFFPSPLTNCTLTLQPFHLGLLDSKSTRPVHPPPCVHPQALRHFQSTWVYRVHLQVLHAAAQTTATPSLCLVSRCRRLSY